VPRLFYSLAVLLLGFTVLTSAGVFDRLGGPWPDQPVSRTASRAAQVPQQHSSVAFPARPAAANQPGTHQPSTQDELPSRSIEPAATSGALAHRRKPATVPSVHTQTTQPLAPQPLALTSNWPSASQPSLWVAASQPRSPIAQPPAPAVAPGPSPQNQSPPLLAGLNLDLTYVNLNSSAYTRFKAWVDRALAGNIGYGFETTDAALMYHFTGNTAYCDLAVRLVEQQVTEAEAAIAAGTNPPVAGDSYLEVGPMIGDLAQTMDSCARRMTAQQVQRWSAYAEQTIWNVWNHASARWGNRSAPWTGWSVDNPGNNYHYSFLTATAYWGLASGRHQAWIDFLNTQKWPPLQAYYAQLPGGGSREGTGYGTAQMRLFTLYRIWRDAMPVDYANANTHTTDTIHYWVHATVPTRDRFAPFGDQSRNSVPELYDYHRRLVLEARALTTNATAKSIASWWLNGISVPQMTSGFNYRHDLLPAGTGGTPPADLTYHARGTGHLFSRTGWDTGAMWVAFAAGPYVESHAHQDQGAFTLFSGDWMAVTSNIWSASGIEQATTMHNLVRFERSGSVVPQREGTTSSMTLTRGAAGAFTAQANLTPAYGSNSPVTSWQRRLDFANRALTVTDSFQLASGTTAIHQTHVPTLPTISGTTATTTRMRMRVLSPAGATLSAVAMGGGRYRIEVRGSATGYTVQYSEP
jgi:hypothetical protein